MNIRIFQKGFNYSQDGTGNRLVYHLQGCNMRCPWCANPEGISSKGTLIANDALLVDSVCPYGAIRNKQIDRDKCAECSSKECISVNKNLGIRFSCEEYDIDSVIDEAMQCSPLFFNGGGVTLTGGEPTTQFEAVKEFLGKLKNKGIHTAIETNATHPMLEMLFPLIDMLIMDFKHYDRTIHTKITGVDNVIIKENTGKALSFHKRVLIRIPVIKEFNDSENDIMNFVAFFKQYETQNAVFEFLPYHEYGKAKWLQCGMHYNMGDAFIEPETLTKYRKHFINNNLITVET